MHIHIDLTDVADGQLLEGVMHVTGRLQEGIEPFETRFRVEFHDEADGRTRLEIRQWLPEHLARPQRAGLARGVHQAGRHAEERPGCCGRSSRWSDMAKLIYVTNVSLDGYIEDEHGAFDLFAPDDDVFASTTDLLRSVGTFLYGRRLYETMAVWETNAALASQSDLTADFATAWQAASKVVYSTTLAAVSTAKTRLERHFDPTAVQQLKTTASSDLTVGGANLAAQAFKAGLVDECQLFVWPMTVGRGKPALPTDTRANLELLDERRFANGVVLLRYRPLG